MKKIVLDCRFLVESIQSAVDCGFRPGHSTETAVLRVMSDLLEAVDSGDVAALVLLDLSPVALASCANCAVSDDQCHRLFSRL